MDHAHSSKLLVHCPLCQAAYEETMVRLVGEKGTTQLFHCTCQACGHAMLALILQSHGGVSSVGVVTDLEIQDALSLEKHGVITEDECIAAHRAMEMESREFCRLLLSTRQSS